MSQNTVPNDPMSPEASPGILGKKTGVRRVNKRPIYIIGGLFTLFLMIIAVVAYDRAYEQNHPQGEQEEKKAAGDTKTFAQEIAGDHTSGLIPAEKSAASLDIPPLPTAQAGEITVPIARPDGLDSGPPLPPGPPASKNPQQRTPMEERMERIQQTKQQMFEEAVTGKTTVQVTDLRSRSGGGSASDGSGSREEMLQKIAEVRKRIEEAKDDDPTAVYKARLAQAQAAVGKGGGDDTSAAPQLLQLAATKSSRNNVSQFSGQGDRWSLDSKPEAPHTPYELRAGFVIPAIMISGINSDLAGQIMGQVSQDVYDTATGKYKLIPLGSRLVGAYSNDVSYGQERVLIAWQRIIFPDGKAMDIGAMPGADSAGYAGFKDMVNHHYFRVFGSAFLMSFITAGIDLSQNRNGTNPNTNTQRASDALSESLGQQLGAATAAMLTKNLNISPTIEIRPGYRFNVMVNKDMTFSKPYHGFDYQFARRGADDSAD